MGLHTLRPNQEGINNAGGYAGTNSGGSLALANNDGNSVLAGGANTINFVGDADGSFAQGLNTGTFVLGYASPYVMASDERCLQWRLIIRAEGPYSGTPASTTFSIGNFAGGHWQDTTATVGSKGDFRSAWFTTYNGAEINQSAIDNVQCKFSSAVVGGGFGNLTTKSIEQAIAIDVRKRPAVQTVSLSGGYTPSVSWTANIYDSQAQTKWQVQIYDLGVNPAPTFGSATGQLYDSTEHSGTATTVASGITLVNGNYRVLMRVAKDFNGASWYSNVFTKDFTLAGTPGVPTSVGPSTTQNTDLPILTANVTQSPDANAPRVKVEWTVASDNAFTTNVVDVVQPDSSLDNGGVHTETINIVDALFTGTWYLRARGVDANGVTSAWSSTISFAVSHPPTAVNLAPDGGGTLIFAVGGTPVTWKFSDTSPVDSQTAFQALLELLDGTIIDDTGKVTSSAVGHTFAIPGTDKDTPLRWTVRLWDRDNVVGPYAGYAFFSVSDAASVTVTAPTGGAVGTPQPTVTWTFSATGGRTQAAYRVAIENVSSSGLVYDSGWIADPSANSNTPPMPVLTNATAYTVIVYVRDSSGLVSTGTSSITTSWSAPANPTFTIDTSHFENSGYVTLNWTNAVKDANWFSWRVYRRHDLLPGTTVGFFLAAGGFDNPDWELIDEELTDQSSYSFDDYGAYANSQDYAVVQVALRFGAEVEADRDSNAESADPAGSDYWLILGHEILSDVTVTAYDFAYKLRHVTSDSMLDEWENSEVHLLNLGRRIEYGTYLGRNGTLEAGLRDVDGGETARSARLSIEWMKKLAIEQNFDLYLRTPFGDIFKVDISGMTFARDPGLGEREHGKLTIPYLEVY